MATGVLDRRRVLAAGAALLLAACAPETTRPATGSRPQPATTGPRRDSDAVRVRFDGFAGGPGFSLPDDLAGRPLVVNFWASWCTPCRKEMPVLQAVSQQLRGRVDFLGVDYLDQAGAARRLAAETGVTYRLAADPRGRAGAKLGITGLPTTLFIDAGGVLAGRRVGELDARRLREAIASYLRVEG
jgi:cytochrome c biogenesis protein CcmG/thiol:disulfide interchange protein DsbE